MAENRNHSKKQKHILYMAMITSFITTFTGSAINLSIPDIETEFGVSAAMVGWIVTAYTLTTAMLSVPMGKIADSTGRRRVLITGVSLFAVLAVSCIFSVNIAMFITLRALQGMAASMIFATNNAILIDAFPLEERGKVLGTSVAATYTGLSLGPVLGGFLNDRFGWRSIFIVTCLVAAVSLFFIVTGAPKDSREGRKAIVDVPGNLLFIASIGLFLCGLTNVTITESGKLMMIAGVLLAVLFVVREQRAQDPLIRLSMFTKDAAFTLSNLAALLNYGATFAITYLLSIYLQVVSGYSSETAGLILIFMPAVQAVLSPLAGSLSDRVAPYKVASLGMLVCAGGLTLFSFIGEGTHLAYVIFALMFEGFGFALFSSPNTNAIMSRVGKKDYSIAQSIVATMRTMGHTSSMAVVTIIVGIKMSGKALTEAPSGLLIDTIRLIFRVFIVLCLIGTLMSMKRGDKKILDED